MESLALEHEDLRHEPRTLLGRQRCGDPSGLLTSHTLLVGEPVREPVLKRRWMAFDE